jgi:hypothetical protein
MDNQLELWAQVNASKRRVRETIAAELSYAFRSSPTYQAYTGLCGEAQMAFEDGMLTEALVEMLAEYATKVCALWETGAR